MSAFQQSADRFVQCQLCSAPTSQVGIRCCEHCWELFGRIRNDRSLMRSAITQSVFEYTASLTERERWRGLDADEKIAELRRLLTTKNLSDFLTWLDERACDMKPARFTVRIIRPNPHRVQTTIWRAGQIVTAMEGCRVDSIVQALTALEEDMREAGVGDPARWLTHFAGLESIESGKSLDAWIEIVHDGEIVRTTARYRELLRASSDQDLRRGADTQLTTR